MRNVLYVRIYTNNAVRIGLLRALLLKHSEEWQ